MGRYGTYRGAFTLPGDVVYGAFALEDPAASRSDTREGRFWEILVHGADGRPALLALKQRFDDHLSRDQLVVLQTAQEMVRLYADSPEAWSALRLAEVWALGQDKAAELVAGHRERLAAFDRTLAPRTDLTRERITALYLYADALEEAEARDRGGERLRGDRR